MGLILAPSIVSTFFKMPLNNSKEAAVIISPVTFYDSSNRAWSSYYPSHYVAQSPRSNVLLALGEILFLSSIHLV